MTRPLNRQAIILEKLGIIWMKQPDLRFCQMMENILHKMTKVENKDPFYIEDDELIRLLDQTIKIIGD